MSKTPPEVKDDDAFHFIVRMLRENIQSPYSNYGYELYLPNVCRAYLEHVHKYGQQDNAQRHAQMISGAFLDAAWEMARRGILRPGVMQSHKQPTEEGSAGCGFTLTAAGKKWIAQSGQYEFVPIDPGRFATQLDSFTSIYGEGFQERSQEAIRCYDALAYLACCSMCGAAAESILLAVATAKSGDADAVEKEYLSNQGRGRIEKRILSNQKQGVQDEFRGYLSLLKYWRDAASHGHRTGIGDSEAYTALALLLRFAQFAKDRWDTLTQT